MAVGILEVSVELLASFCMPLREYGDWKFKTVQNHIPDDSVVVGSYLDGNVIRILLSSRQIKEDGFVFPSPVITREPI